MGNLFQEEALLAPFESWFKKKAESFEVKKFYSGDFKGEFGENGRTFE